MLLLLMPTLDADGAFDADKSPPDLFHSCDGEEPPL